MKLKSSESLTKATYGEFQASLFGACGIALGLGALFASFIKPLAIITIIIGIFLHGWGMYRIHKRNN